MATKKTNKKTKQNTSKKTSSNRQKTADRADAIRVSEIATVAVSVILFCLAIVSGNGVWNVLHNVYVGIFGMFAAIVLPLLTIVVTVIFSAKGDDAYGYTAKIVEAFVMVFILATFIHVVKNSTGDAFKETIINSYKSASFEFNGGFIGAVLGWLLLTLGKAPAVIISVVLFIVDLLLMTGLTIFQFVAGAAKPAKVTYEKVAPAIEERIERRRMNKENIDVPLDTQPPEEEDKKPKSRKKKAASSDEEMTKVPKEIIDEINRENSNIEMLKNATGRKEEKKPKSIDEIVKDASEDKSNEKKADKSKEFTVSKEAMESGINDYKLPSVELLSLPKKKSTADISGELKENAQRLIETLRSFNVNATITDISRGPTVTRYELKPAAGVRISKITNLADDIALNLAATHVRIEAPIPGKAAVGIEVPNTVKNTVSMRELIDTPEFYEQRSLLSAGIGKDIAGNCVYCDIAKMPHLLVAGTTGSGKSVCMNSIITSILYRAKPDEVKFLMIDPKQVEFSKYANIPHLLVPVVTDPRKAAGALGWAVSEMLQRYQKLSQVGVRDIEGYNKYVQKHEDMESMPKICIFIDEFADLMMAAPKEVEDSVCRLAQWHVLSVCILLLQLKGRLLTLLQVLLKLIFHQELHLPFHPKSILVLFLMPQVPKSFSATVICFIILSVLQNRFVFKVVSFQMKKLKRFVISLKIRVKVNMMKKSLRKLKPRRFKIRNLLRLRMTAMQSSLMYFLTKLLILYLKPGLLPLHFYNVSFP